MYTPRSPPSPPSPPPSPPTLLASPNAKARAQSHRPPQQRHYLLPQVVRTDPQPTLAGASGTAQVAQPLGRSNSPGNKVPSSTPLPRMQFSAFSSPLLQPLLARSTQSLHVHNPSAEAFARAAETIRMVIESYAINHRAAVYQPTRVLELEVPTKGPTWKQVSASIANCLIGAGVIGLPYALRVAGWSALLIIIAATVVASVTAKMIVWSFDELNERKRANPRKYMGKGYVCTYDQLAEEVLGHYGGVAMKAVTFLECYGVAICFVVLHSTNWPALLHLDGTVFGLPPPIACVIVMLVLFVPVLIVRPRYLSYLAIVGVFGTASLLLALVFTPFFSSVPMHTGDACALLDKSLREGASTHHTTCNLGGWGIATGLVLFCFGGHATFPEMYAQMTAEQRPYFDRAVTVGFVAAGAFYFVVSGIPYYFWGSCVADTLTLNLMHSSPLLGSIATVAILANTFCSMATFYVPVVRIVADSLSLCLPRCFDNSVASEEDDDNNETLLLPFKLSTFSVRIPLVVVSGVLALSIPNFSFVVALMGAVTTMLVCFILPVVFFLIVRWHALSKLAIGGCFAILIVGAAGMIAGLQNSFSGV